MSSVSPGGADLVPTTPDWPAWVGFMVTTHFDLVSGPFHSPIFIGLHSVSTSANMYHLNTRAGELPRSASSHFIFVLDIFCQQLYAVFVYWIICITVFVTLGGQHSRGPICRTSIIQGAQFAALTFSGAQFALAQFA